MFAVKMLYLVGTNILLMHITKMSHTQTKLFNARKKHKQQQNIH